MTLDQLNQTKAQNDFVHAINIGEVIPQRAPSAKEVLKDFESYIPNPNFYLLPDETPDTKYRFT